MQGEMKDIPEIKTKTKTKTKTCIIDPFLKTFNLKMLVYHQLPSSQWQKGKDCRK